MKALKIKHNNVLGYFIEVPAAQGEKLLSMAAGDEELSGLLAESFELADQPVLYLWYRPIGTP